MFLTRYALRRSCFVYSCAVHRVTAHRNCSIYRPLISSHIKNRTSRCSIVVSTLRYLSSSAQEQTPLTAAQKLKRAVKDYGFTVVVFHVTISLISLGTCYLAVYSGLDIITLLGKVGLNLGERMSTVVEGAGTFAVAYAVHKVFAPVRISITLGTVPFIVRYFRKIGLLKPPKT